MQKVVSRRVQKHQLKKQPKKQPKKRTRGRPRRIRHPPITHDLRPNYTQARQPTSPDLPERREQEKSATAADKPPLLTRKRKSCSRESVLEQNPVECDPPSNGPEHSSLCLSPRTRRFASRVQRVSLHFYQLLIRSTPRPRMPTLRFSLGQRIRPHLIFRGQNLSAIDLMIPPSHWQRRPIV